MNMGNYPIHITPLGAAAQSHLSVRTLLGYELIHFKRNDGLYECRVYGFMEYDLVWIIAHTATDAILTMEEEIISRLGYDCYRQRCYI